ncbi:GGDEF domain-containing protein [Sphingomonas donggukensis]|uniref:diguanylate cyclase n=1 Tax=Sphingomonas donggukensis TaxID=2949093 RepID=A0ABY4TX22_9SPHN|nr:diguanylate cyclase [Sphingomonas donggukensis]URW76062.1 GGDEF domain-containing protein [Sphingomonas donggukensis]
MSGDVLVRTLLALIGVATAMLAQPAAAQAGLAGTPLATCIARVLPGDTPATVLRAPGRFDCTTPQTDFGPGDYWVLSAPIATSTSKRHIRVRIGSLWQERLTLHTVYADGAVATTATDSTTVSRHVQLGAIVEFAPPWRAAPVTRLLWRVDGSANTRGIIFGQRIADAQESAHANTTMAAIYSAFAGLAIAFLIYNLSLWGALRHRFQLTYCAMVLALLAYAASSSGALAWAFPGIDNNDRMRINYATLGLGASMAIVFARAFFEPRVFSGWLGRTTWVAAVLLGISGFCFAALSHINMPVADRIASIIFLFGLTVTIPILWNAWTRGSSYLWLFSLGWAAPVLFAGARILSALGLYQSNFWLDNSTVFSLAFEALVSSIAIAYRVQMLSRERDEALASETAARLLADADPLTGLLNRRAFLAQSIGRRGIQTLHVIDIDHFKAVNETLGHDGGDEVLRVFARTLRQAIPTGAVVARIGGEEFAIVLDADIALEADRILAALRAARMPFDLTVTSSIGSCSGSLDTELDWKRLYRSADRALFEAKTAGRDRARRAAPLTPDPPIASAA